MLSNTAVPEEYGAFREKVMSGEIPVCEEIALEMARIDYLIESPDYYYDSDAIKGYVSYCNEELTLTDGSDLVLLDSFRLWAEQVWAWFYYVEEPIYNKELKRFENQMVLKRLTKKQYLIVARGAAKSMYGSTMQSYGLVIDMDTTNQITTAPTMRQADEVMAPIRTAITRSRGPLFKFLTMGSLQNTTGKRSDRVKLVSTKKGIENMMTGSLLEVRAMAVDKLQGARPKYCTVDEWLSGNTREDVIGPLEQGATKLDDYWIIAMSSEGTVRDGVGDEIKLELLKILHGEYFAPHISIFYYKLDDVKEVADPEMYVKANPNIGITVKYEAVLQDVERAELSPATRNDILAKRFGIPVEGYTYYFTYEETIPQSYKSFDGMACSKGADMSQGDDFCAFTFLFPLRGGKFGVKTYSFITETKHKKLTRTMREKYQKFIDEGTLEVLPGTVLDMMVVYEMVDEFIMQHEYTVCAFGYDPYNATAYVSRYVIENGEYGVEKVIQGAKTESVPLGEIKHMVEEGGMHHDEELMAFAMKNSIAIVDPNGNRKLSKARDDEKIDNVAALLDAWVAYRRNPECFA